MPPLVKQPRQRATRKPVDTFSGVTLAGSLVVARRRAAGMFPGKNLRLVKGTGGYRVFVGKPKAVPTTRRTRVPKTTVRRPRKKPETFIQQFDRRTAEAAATARAIKRQAEEVRRRTAPTVRAAGRGVAAAGRATATGAVVAGRVTGQGAVVVGRGAAAGGRLAQRGFLSTRERLREFRRARKDEQERKRRLAEENLSTEPEHAEFESES